MPYIIKNVGKKFQVCKADNVNECFSKKGLPLKKAQKQRTAIILSELKIKKKVIQ
jgi:hypothetical protein